MAHRSEQTSERPRDTDKRQVRADRILDAAGALILRWGYNKTTIDDIARQAGVAKGTIYLHWKTREDLFAALMLREKLALAEDIRQRTAADPAGATLHGMFKHSALALMRRPLLKAVLLRDMDVVGRLVHSLQSTAAYTDQLAGFRTYLEFLRDHNLVRTDLSLRAQTYMVSAIFMGFFLIAPLMPAELALSDEEMADLLAETVRRTFEVARPVAADELRGVDQAFAAYVSKSVAQAQAQLQQEIDPQRSEEEYPSER